MTVKELKRTTCENVGELIDALKKIPISTKLECFCADSIEVIFSCDKDDESRRGVELDS